MKARKNRLKFEMLLQRERLFERWLQVEQASRDLSFNTAARLDMRRELGLLSQELRELDSYFLPKTKRGDRV